MLLPRLLRQRLLHVPLHLMELRILLLCLPTLLLATTLEPDQKSILTDNDWKKLWMRGGINADSKLDNNLDSSDSPMFEDSEVSTPTGIISHFVNLQVVVPEAFILGSGELHVDMGSTINLVCIIEKSPTPPQYVYWQKNDRLINYYDSRRDISIETTPGPRTQSRLIIREPQITDSGNYTCSASNTEPASIYVFVSKGDNMAAISRRKTSSADRITHIFRSMLAPCLLLNTVVVRRIFLT
ncbi:uncharacterized protein LOC133842295 isoform X5 [Drosophila sulfurigaster albostrigata]|uniref:uncharacterized protein LOC133842295 isoform X5 n=1 Tax=Drosophila sulfurigaster albostrigata TaxID=89887 RepID=UPI002D218CA3|nr:uncharacterized protein LOC133842295 isoform X5 [Drosophila sulfurigaster albostrigata]